MRQERCLKLFYRPRAISQTLWRTIQQVVKMLQIVITNERVERKVIHLVNTTKKRVTHHLNVGEGQMQSAASAMRWVMKMWFLEKKFNKLQLKQKMHSRKRNTVSLLQKKIQAISHVIHGWFIAVAKTIWLRKKLYLINWRVPKLNG